MNLKKNKLREESKDMLSHINIGSGTEITIKELAKKISKVVGYNGKILFISTKNDGTPDVYMKSESSENNNQTNEEDDVLPFLSNNLLFYKLENIKSDTTMRDSIADTGSEPNSEDPVDDN